MPQFELAQAGTEQRAEDSADKFREQIIALLPGLSAFAYCLTGNAEQPDDLVEETCARALADKDQWQPGTNLGNWVFGIAQNLWFNRQRAKKFRSEPMGSEVADHLVGSGGRAVTENRLALDDLLRALSRISPQHRVLIALVSACGLTYTEAAEIVNLPVKTVIRRLARGRLALLDAVAAAIASKATRH
jgi:RNA polymerase sigma-70 factor (ECF subfamily)